MNKGRPIGRFSSRRFNGSTKFVEEQYAPLTYVEVRSVVLSILKEMGPMKSDPLVEEANRRGASLRDAWKVVKYLAEDGKITRVTGHNPWELAPDPTTT